MNRKQSHKFEDILAAIANLADDDPTVTYFQDDDLELRVTVTITIKK